MAAEIHTIARQLGDFQERALRAESRLEYAEIHAKSLEGQLRSSWIMISTFAAIATIEAAIIVFMLVTK